MFRFPISTNSKRIIRGIFPPLEGLKVLFFCYLVGLIVA